jgi:hypothetical protein
MFLLSMNIILMNIHGNTTPIYKSETDLIKEFETKNKKNPNYFPSLSQFLESIDRVK